MQRRSELEMRSYKELEVRSLPRSTVVVVLQALIVAVTVAMFWFAFSRPAYTLAAAGAAAVLVVAMAVAHHTRRCHRCGSKFTKFENVDKTTEHATHYFVVCSGCRHFFRDRSSTD